MAEPGLQSSTEHATLELIDSIVNVLNDKHALAVFIDLSKVFETLDNNILLDKLWHYGIRGVPHKLFKSYLEHKKQLVINKDTMSVIKYKIWSPTRIHSRTTTVFDLYK